MTAKTDTRPHRLSLCTLLGRGDHAAGVLLDRIVAWGEHGKATINGYPGHWVANKRAWWMREAQLSPGQLDRALAKLCKLSLIERHQAKFAGGSPILHTRPTTFTSDFLTAARTWNAAFEIMTDEGIELPGALEWTKPAHTLTAMVAAFGADSVTADDVGKLALYREAMKEPAHEIDASALTVELIAWAVEHWDKPSIAHFCANFMQALGEAGEKTAA